ncbi:Integrase, catalytic core [Fusarium oxysporum f. sp. albedinis]|nr:Integrase, catalytic core [Fusarium oxysporum f. sp. albedinis]
MRPIAAPMCMGLHRSRPIQHHSHISFCPFVHTTFFHEQSVAHPCAGLTQPGGGEACPHRHLYLTAKPLFPQQEWPHQTLAPTPWRLQKGAACSNITNPAVLLHSRLAYKAR